MKTLKSVFALVLAFTAQIAMAQYSGISDEEILLRKWRSYGHSFEDEQVIKRWLYEFDKNNYSSYSKNDFQLRSKMDQTKKSLAQRFSNLKSPAIFYYETNRNFGAYDFDKEKFAFKPFKNINLEATYNLFAPFSTQVNNMFFGVLKIVDLDFVDGIAMNKDKAERFYNKRLIKNSYGQDYNKRVYLKVYYTHSLNDNFPVNTKDGGLGYLKGSPALVQAFDDKDYSSFICEWWSPVLSNDIKQQLISNRIPREGYQNNAPIGGSPRLDNNAVWGLLYPYNNTFDSNKRLVRKVKKGNEYNHYRTEIGKTFFYSAGSQQKAVVILFSHSSDSGGDIFECHACHPEFDVATFIYSNGIWIKQRFIENWSGGSGSWGSPDKITLEYYNNKNCLKVSGSYGNHGRSVEYMSYYDIETLDKIASFEKEN
ncbi:MAG: DUF4852 domain-containing protein [Chitinophagales bacterium]|nr:DUF4852 domain-containing protein [Chitinophagales bacterium]